MTNEDVIDELLLVWEAKKFKIVNIKQYIIEKNFVILKIYFPTFFKIKLLHFMKFCDKLVPYYSFIFFNQILYIIYTISKSCKYVQGIPN